MNHLKIDIERQYSKRDDLFLRRWELSSAHYGAQVTAINAAIHGYETVLCTVFPQSLQQIFVSTEAYAG